MARTRFGSDHGLSIRMFIVGLMIVGLYVVLGGVLFFIHLPITLVIIIPIALLFGQYYFSDSIALFAMHGKVVSESEAPKLHGIIDRLCASANMPKPRVAIANSDIPNAFATGRSPKTAVVCATSGIIRRLDDAELEAVLSHELSHVAHRDVAVMTIAGAVGVLAGLLMRSFLFFGIGLGGGRNNNSGGFSQDNSNFFMVELAVMLASVVVYALSYILTMALSRYRELAADRSGAILIGRPAVLKSALIKVTGDMRYIPTKDLRAAEHYNAFFFAPALSNGFSVSTLFSTHPSLEVRLQKLDELEAQMNKPR